MTSSSPSTQSSKLRLAVLLLAAGEGSRLGSYPKVLLRKDGYTLLLGSVGPVEVLPSVMKKVPYDPEKDFAPIT